MKLLGSTKSRIKKDKNGKNFPYAETKEVALIHCNAVNNSYHLYHFLYIFVPDKSFGQLLDTSPGNLISLKLLIQNFLILIDSLQIKIQSSRNRRQNKYHFSF